VPAADTSGHTDFSRGLLVGFIITGGYKTIEDSSLLLRQRLHRAHREAQADDGGLFTGGEHAVSRGDEGAVGELMEAGIAGVAEAGQQAQGVLAGAGLLDVFILVFLLC
jgi:hypothetical protein